jgi:hypothetical protein
MTSGPRKCVSIRIEFDNGDVLTGRDAHADKVWRWWISLELFAYAHDVLFNGEPLQASIEAVKRRKGEKT